MSHSAEFFFTSIIKSHKMVGLIGFLTGKKRMGDDLVYMLTWGQNSSHRNR